MQTFALLIVAATAVMAGPLAEQVAVPSCHYSHAPTNKEWRIVLTDDQKYNTNCGRGVLDNVRGVCGNIESWECKYTDAEKGQAIASFRSPKGCKASDVAGAVNAAYNGDLGAGFHCTDHAGAHQ